MSVTTIRRRSKAEKAQTDQTCTPKWLCDLLPEVDIDPLSNCRSHVNARWSYSLDKGLDGLKLPWKGAGFTNWPFGYPRPFADKAMYELRIGNCIDLITLCKLDPGTKWWKTITWFDHRFPHPGTILQRPPDMWLLDKRVQYDEHPDVIEKRRLDRIAKAIEDGDGTDDIDGESTSNFVSVILHRRFSQNPRLKLDGVATLWEQPL